MFPRWRSQCCTPSGCGPQQRHALLVLTRREDKLLVHNLVANSLAGRPEPRLWVAPAMLMAEPIQGGTHRSVLSAELAARAATRMRTLLVLPALLGQPRSGWVGNKTRMAAIRPWHQFGVARAAVSVPSELSQSTWPQRETPHIPFDSPSTLVPTARYKLH